MIKQNHFENNLMIRKKENIPTNPYQRYQNKIKPNGGFRGTTRCSESQGRVARIKVGSDRKSK